MAPFGAGCLSREGVNGWELTEVKQELPDYLVPQTDKAWATGNGARKARAEPVPISKVRNTKTVMIFAEMVISILGTSVGINKSWTN